MDQGDEIFFENGSGGETGMIEGSTTLSFFVEESNSLELIPLFFLVCL